LLTAFTALAALLEMLLRAEARGARLRAGAATAELLRALETARAEPDLRADFLAGAFTDLTEVRLAILSSSG
jgi:glycine/D-amino acid oxidase-like deaminating enzyme